MEDRHTIIPDYRPAGPADDAVLRSYAAVFDGHNGAESAEHAASRCAARPGTNMQRPRMLQYRGD